MEKSAKGSYQIARQGNILFVDAHGPFNDVTAERYHEDIVQYTEEMLGVSWGSLITFHGNNLFTPDVELQIRETTHYRQQKGMIAIAVVILDSAYADVQQMQLQQIYSDYQLTFHVFSDSEMASEWLYAYLKQNN